MPIRYGFYGFTLTGVAKYSYFVVHTDDIDGIAQNPKHGQMITDACHDEWKVDVGDPRHMLGVTREISYDKETGVGKNQYTAGLFTGSNIGSV